MEQGGYGHIAVCFDLAIEKEGEGRPKTPRERIRQAFLRDGAIGRRLLHYGIQVDHVRSVHVIPPKE